MLRRFLAILSAIFFGYFFEVLYSKEPQNANVMGELKNIVWNSVAKEKDNFQNIESFDLQKDLYGEESSSFWKRFHYVGDMSFLYAKESDRFSDKDDTEHVDYLIRCRSAFISDISDKMELGLRLIVQNTKFVDPIRNIDTSLMGKVGFDRAYLKYKFAEKGTFLVGVFANPFFSTNLIFDEKLVFSGLAEGFTSCKKYANFYYILGQFPLKKHKRVESDEDQNKEDFLDRGQSTVDRPLVDYWEERSFLWAGQTGCIIDIMEDLEMELAVSYFVFTNVAGKTVFERDMSSEFSLMQFYSNDGKYLNGYKLLNFIGQIQFYIKKLPTTIRVNVIKNFGESLQETPSQFKNSAHEVGVSFGSLENSLSQLFSFTYRYVEPCSLFNVFAGKDFANFGTNYKGWKVKWCLNITASLCLGISFSRVRPIYSIMYNRTNEGSSDRKDEQKYSQSKQIKSFVSIKF